MVDASTLASVTEVFACVRTAGSPYFRVHWLFSNNTRESHLEVEQVAGKEFGKSDCTHESYDIFCERRLYRGSLSRDTNLLVAFSLTKGLLWT